MPTVVGCKCIFGSCLGWEVRLGRFSWSGFPEMTENESGFVQETFFVCLFLMFGKRTNKRRCSLFVALSEVGIFHTHLKFDSSDT